MSKQNWIEIYKFHSRILRNFCDHKIEFLILIFFKFKYLLLHLTWDPKYLFPSQSTLVKQGYKIDNKFSENCIDRLLGVQYSVLWRGFSNGRLVVPPELKPPVSRAKLKRKFMLLLGRKSLGGKTGVPLFLFAIFRDSEFVDATLCASRPFKPRQFH